MSCTYDGCSMEIKNSCRDCCRITYWCDIHSKTHENETDHKLNCINKEKFTVVSPTTLKSTIENYIIEMVKDTEKVIKALKKASSDAIKTLKETAKNMKNISEFELDIELALFQFSKERITFLVEEVGQISKDIKINLNAELSDLKQKLDEKEKILTDIGSLQRTLQDLERVKGYAYLGLQSLGKEEKIKFFLENFGEIYDTYGCNEEAIRNNYRELLFSNDGRYCFYCNF